MFQFTRKGVIFTKQKGDEVMMAALEAGAEDVIDEEDGTTIYTVASDLAKVREAIINSGIEIDSAELQYVPNNTVELDDEKAEKVEKLLNAVDDLDDVTAVHTNAA
jgi:transcriptional/translational regulatory protein YebC/TACO1